MHDYNKMMNRLLKLPACSLVTTGRTGTCYLQSLLDSHPEILTFNGPLLYDSFWKSSACVSAGKFDVGDFIDEFIGEHIGNLKSRYDLRDGKDQLGNDRKQSLDIHLREFRNEFMKLLEGREVDSRNSLLAIYGAYALCLGQEIEDKKLFFHHAHNFEELLIYLQDFPNSKIICMTRDPRANFVSCVEHWRKFDPATDFGWNVFFHIRRILRDATPLEAYDNECLVIRVEDLGSEHSLRQLSNWLTISYDDILTRSTWGGLAWHGDRISERGVKDSGLSRDILRNKWEEKLSVTDKFVLAFIMHYRLKHYGYSHNTISIYRKIGALFLILMPLRYEWRFFSLKYLRKCIQDRRTVAIARNSFSYVRRVMLFIRYYFRVLRKQQFTCPYLLLE